jgi:hypothetical protein
MLCGSATHIVSRGAFLCRRWVLLGRSSVKIEMPLFLYLVLLGVVVAPALLASEKKVLGAAPLGCISEGGDVFGFVRRSCRYEVISSDATMITETNFYGQIQSATRAVICRVLALPCW